MKFLNGDFIMDNLGKVNFYRLLHARQYSRESLISAFGITKAEYDNLVLDIEIADVTLEKRIVMLVEKYSVRYSSIARKLGLSPNKVRQIYLKNGDKNAE